MSPDGRRLYLPGGVIVGEGGVVGGGKGKGVVGGGGRGGGRGSFYCLDANTGEVIWEDDGSGEDEDEGYVEVDVGDGDDRGDDDNDGDDAQYGWPRGAIATEAKYFSYDDDEDDATTTGTTSISSGRDVVYAIDRRAGSVSQYDALTGDILWRIDCSHLYIDDIDDRGEGDDSNIVNNEGRRCRRDAFVEAEFDVSEDGGTLYYGDVLGRVVGLRAANRRGTIPIPPLPILRAKVSSSALRWLPLSASL